MDQRLESIIAAKRRQLLRFLILGNEKGAYHSKEPELLEYSVACVEDLIAEGRAIDVVDKVKKVVNEGRCIRMNAPLMALARVCCATEEEHKAARDVAYRAIPDICKTPTHIFTFLQYLKKLKPDNEEQDQPDGGGQKAGGKVVEQKADGKGRGQKAGGKGKGQKEVGKGRGQKAEGKGRGQKADDKAEGQQMEGDVQPSKKKSSWNRSKKKAVEAWYLKQHKEQKLAMLVTKYRKREGWSHKQVLQNVHIKPKKDRALDVILCYITKGLKEAKQKERDHPSEQILKYLNAVEDARSMVVPKDAPQVEGAVLSMVDLIRDYRLLREHVSQGFLQFSRVWGALLEEMPLMALLRNLGRMTSTGTLKEKDRLDLVLKKLRNIPVWDRSLTLKSKEQSMKDKEENCFRIHPYTILTAWYAYKTGRSRKSKVKWTAEPEICHCLEQTFYQSFDNVPHTNLRIMVAMDVTESMSKNSISNSDGSTSRTLTARVASAAMCLVTLKVESRADVFAFSPAGGIQDLDLGTDSQLEAALEKIQGIQSGHKDESLDCTQPLIWALKNKKKYDAFIIYTDNIHSFQTSPAEALRKYREQLGMEGVRLAVVGMSSTGFSMADPEDHGMMDVVGFDIKTPDVLHDFISGKQDDCASMN